jgi:hypothetical protein
MKFFKIQPPVTVNSGRKRCGYRKVAGRRRVSRDRSGAKGALKDHCNEAYRPGPWAHTGRVRVRGVTDPVHGGTGAWGHGAISGASEGRYRSGAWGHGARSDQIISISSTRIQPLFPSFSLTSRQSPMLSCTRTFVPS